MLASTGLRDPDALAGRGADGRLGSLLTRRVRTRRFVFRLVMAAFGVTKEQEKRDRDQTGEILDRVDAWVAEGVLNGEQLRSPDLAVASSLALVEYILELQPELRRRPSFALVERVFSRSAAARGRA
jgi:hypothetical protein